MNILNQLKPYRQYVLLGLYILLFSHLFQMMLRDVTWWFGFFFYLPLTSLVLYLYDDKIKHDLLLRQRLFHVFGIAFCIGFVFVFFATYMSIIWIIGFIPVGYLFFLWNPFSVATKPIQLPIMERRITLYTTILVSFYCLAYLVSFNLANSSENPKSHFPSQYDAVESYKIYGQVGEKDREHIIPIDWFENDNHFVNDYVNVIWSNKTANNRRGKLEFGIVPKTEQNKVYSDGVLVGYRNSQYFMPLDEYKGDVARIVLYMYVVYRDDGLPLSKINVNLMKYWARLDPVDQREMARNQEIQRRFDYSNRFVDVPWFINLIV